MTIQRRIWDWLPPRRTRGRVTSPAVIAANLDLDPGDVWRALLDMETRGEAVADKRGSWHRGVAMDRREYE